MNESKNRWLRKILNLVEALEIDREEFEEEDSIIYSDFVNEFAEELKFLEKKTAKKNTDQVNPTSKTEENQISLNVEIENVSEFKKKFKNIHKSVVSKIHPDIAGENFEEYFKEFQSFWQKEDLVGMLKIASDLKLKIDLEENLHKEVGEEICGKREEIKRKKMNLRWAWSKSKKDQNTRDRVIQSLGINKKEFDEWKKNKSNEDSSTEKKENFKMLTFE